MGDDVIGLWCLLAHSVMAHVDDDDGDAVVVVRFCVFRIAKHDYVGWLARASSSLIYHRVHTLNACRCARTFCRNGRRMFVCAHVWRNARERAGR